MQKPNEEEQGKIKIKIIREINQDPDNQHLSFDKK